MTSLSNMSKLFKITQTIQEDFACLNCKQTYKKKWCSSDNAPCYFCTLYLPMKDTYTSILQELDWRYLKSGETSRKEYYNDFLNNLNKWATRFHVFPTKQDLKTIEELRGVSDWTRNEPNYDYYY
jgi:hypothetical protein